VQVNNLDHYNIIGPQALLEQVKDFYLRIFDFPVGPRPEFDIEGAWLYNGEQSLVHLVLDENASCLSGGGVINHIALACEGLEAFIERLTNENVQFKLLTVPQLSITQLFFHDPAGVGLELNFKEELTS
jgi:4-hydroxyphenylpyruvate dioxygenase-like putative hemolysin